MSNDNKVSLDDPFFKKNIKVFNKLKDENNNYLLTHTSVSNNKWSFNSATINIPTTGNYSLTLVGTSLGCTGVDLLNILPQIQATPISGTFTSNTLTLTNQIGVNYYKNGTYTVDSGTNYGKGFEPFNAFNGGLYSNSLSTANSTSTTYIYTYTGSDQNVIVPPGTTSMYVQCWGAGGASRGLISSAGNYTTYPGGGGGYTSGTFAVNGGEKLNVVVGAGGSSGTTSISFKPTAIAGCVLWLDANDPNNTGVLPTNGASLTSWKDKSGLGNNGSSTNGVIWNNNTLNNLPAFYFTNQTSIGYFFSGSVSITSNTMTIFAIVNMNSSSTAAARVISFSNGSGTNDYNNAAFMGFLRQSNTGYQP